MIDGPVKVSGFATAKIPIMSPLDPAESGRVFDEARRQGDLVWVLVDVDRSTGFSVSVSFF